jgi:hypothetical protein
MVASHAAQVPLQRAEPPVGLLQLVAHERLVQLGARFVEHALAVSHLAVSQRQAMQSACFAMAVFQGSSSSSALQPAFRTWNFVPAPGRSPFPPGQAQRYFESPQSVAEPP